MNYSSQEKASHVDSNWTRMFVLVICGINLLFFLFLLYQP